MNLGGPEILVILIVALLVFGPTRLPEIGKQLGKAIREIRKIEHRVKTEISTALELDEPVAQNDGAPFYGDPTNVPDAVVAPERERGVDDHNTPPPIELDEPADPTNPSTPPTAS